MQIKMNSQIQMVMHRSFEVMTTAFSIKDPGTRPGLLEKEKIHARRSA